MLVVLAVAAVGSVADAAAVAVLVNGWSAGWSTGTVSVRSTVTEAPTSTVSQVHRTWSSSAGLWVCGS